MKGYQRAVMVLLLALLNIYLFWPGSLYFLNDDFVHIPLTAGNQLFQTNSVRPLHELLVKLDLLIWNKNAAGFHITALALHFIVTIQLYGLCGIILQRMQGATKALADRVAFLAVTLFLLYPQHSESIAWILGRTPVLSCVFLLAAVRMFFSKRFLVSTHLLGAVAFAAALFTYEQSILVPLVLFAVAFLEKNKERRKGQMRFALALSIAGVVYIVCRKLITTEVIGNYEGGNIVAFQVKQLALNFCRLVVRLFVNPSVHTWEMLATFALIAVAGIIMIRKASPGNALLFCGAVVLVLLLPVVSLGISTHSYESGRYMYLPSVFLVIALGIVITAAVQHLKIFRVPVLLLCGYWLAGKWQGSRDYVAASAYSKKITQTVSSHFDHSADTLRIDTLQQEIHGLPVFRIGFMQGMNWINHSVDSNKIVIYQHP